MKIPPIAANGSLSVNIDVELEIMGVMMVDKDAGIVKFKAAFRQWWYDPRLEWNPADFPGNVTRILVSSEDEDVWVPDTVVREDAGGNFFSDFKMTPVRLYSSGLNYWTRLGELTVSASLDFTNYPYDDQRINVTIGSWLYTDDRLHFTRYKESDGLRIQDPNNW
jgi:Neurotransmitter-gated ion-channel ligand binding domain